MKFVLSIFALLSLGSVVQAQQVYSFESTATSAVITQGEEKKACSQAAQLSYDKGVKLCQNLGGNVESVGAHHLVLDPLGTYCTVIITFNCATNL